MLLKVGLCFGWQLFAKPKNVKTQWGHPHLNTSSYPKAKMCFYAEAESDNILSFTFYCPKTKPKPLRLQPPPPSPHWGGLGTFINLRGLSPRTLASEPFTLRGGCYHSSSWLRELPLFWYRGFDVYYRNDPSKYSLSYSGRQACFYSLDCMEWLWVCV